MTKIINEFCHIGKGEIITSKNTDVYRIALSVEPDIVELARALIPQYIGLNRTKYSPHISIVRDIIIDPKWQLYNGEIVEYYYSSTIHYDKIYYWLNAESFRLRQIRTELNLCEIDWYNRPPDRANCFHITIGNLKNRI